MVSITKIRTYFLVLYSIIVLKVFNLTPLQDLVDIFLIFLSVVGICILVQKGFKRIVKQCSSYLIVFCFIGILSVFSSYYFLEQPIFSGIIAINRYLIIFSCVYPLELLTRRKVSLNKVVKILMNLVWIYYLYLMLITIFGVNYHVVSLISNNVLEINASKASLEFINFGAFFYLAKFILRGNSKNLLLMLLLYSANHFSDIQRGSLIVFSTILIYGIFKISQLKTRFKFVVITSVFSAFLLLFALNNPKLTSNAKEKFSQSWLLFYGEEEITDASIYIRSQEIEFAWGHFLKSPLFGNGIIRASKKDMVFGNQYFYYPDIGIISVLFAFGLIGLLIFWKIIRDVWNIKVFHLRRSIPILTIYLFCASLILLTITKGVAILKPLTFVFFISVIYLQIDKYKISLRSNRSIPVKSFYEQKPKLQHG